MTTKREEAVFLLKPWKRSLHPGTHREHYKHKMNAIKASSSYMLRDALIPVKERSSYKHPVLGENIFDFERKIERTENPFRKEALLEKIKEMHQKDGQRERHYYVANDIFGAYNRKKIKAKFPIPGSAIQSYNERNKWKDQERKRTKNLYTERRKMHVERSKGNFRSSLEFIKRDENAREIDRLIELNRKTNNRIIRRYNEDPRTANKVKFDTVSAEKQFKILSMPYTHVDPNKFRCAVYPATQRQQLEYLWNCQTMDPNPTDLMSNLDVIKSVELSKTNNMMTRARSAAATTATTSLRRYKKKSTSPISKTSQLPQRRLVNEYGSAYRKVHMEIEQQKRNQRTLNAKIERERLHRKRLEKHKKKLLENYRLKRGSISAVYVNGKVVGHQEAALIRSRDNKQQQ